MRDLEECPPFMPPSLSICSDIDSDLYPCYPSSCKHVHFLQGLGPKAHKGFHSALAFALLFTGAGSASRTASVVGVSVVAGVDVVDRLQQQFLAPTEPQTVLVVAS